MTLTKVSNANIYKYKQFDISCKIKIILRKKFLVFKTQGLYCHELIFSKWVNLQKPIYQDESRTRSQDESYRVTTRKQGHFDKHVMHDIQKKGSTGKNFRIFSPRHPLNGISIENLTHRCTQTRQFFPKSGNFLSIFKNDRGDLPPPPCQLHA